MRPALILLLGLSLVAGCGAKDAVHTSDTVHTGSTTTSAGPPTSAGSSTTADPASSSTTVAPFTGGGTTAVSTPPGGRALLTGVSVAAHPGFDRIVFEFSGDGPGYLVRYIDRPVQEDPSGKAVTVAGDAVLEVHMEHASGVDLSGGMARPTYNGPHRIAGPGPAVAEIVDAGDFEGVLRWVAGTHGKPAFKVSTLSGPTRVVVDVAS
jgi:hypothetical protein